MTRIPIKQKVYRPKRQSLDWVEDLKDIAAGFAMIFALIGLVSIAILYFG